MAGETSGPKANSAWCHSGSVETTVFSFTWTISDYQMLKETVRREEGIESSTFAVQVGLPSSLILLCNTTLIMLSVQWEKYSVVSGISS